MPRQGLAGHQGHLHRNGTFGAVCYGALSEDCGEVFLLPLLPLVAVVGALSQQSPQRLQQSGKGPLAGSVFFRGCSGY